MYFCDWHVIEPYVDAAYLRVLEGGISTHGQEMPKNFRMHNNILKWVQERRTQYRDLPNECRRSSIEIARRDIRNVGENKVYLSYI